MHDDVAAVTAVLTEADGWAVDQHVGYDGLYTIVAVRDADGLTFSLSGPANRLEVARIQNDKLTPCGTFTCLEAALDAVVEEVSKT